VITDILTEYSVSSGNILSSNYPVRIFHFQGETPLDKIKQILKPIWAEWHMSGMALFTNQPAYAPSGPADWTITDYLTIQQLNVKKTRADVVTRCTAQRIQPAAGLALDKEGIDVGLHTDALDYAIVNPSLDWDASMGVINLIYLFDDDDAYSGTFPALPPAGAATQLNYVFQQKGGLTEDEAARLYYHITLKGDKPQSGAEWGSLYEEDYVVNKTNTTLETALGDIIPARDPILEPLIPNQTWAATYCEGFLKEAGKRLEMVSGRIGFYCEMIPGQVVALTDHYTGTTGYYYTEEVTQTMSGGDFSTSVVLSKPRADSYA
jgi:hypothetical protein